MLKMKSLPQSIQECAIYFFGPNLVILECAAEQSEIWTETNEQVQYLD